MAVEYKDYFNFSYKEIVDSLDSRYFTKNEMNDIYFLLGKEKELDKKELINHKNKLKKIMQKPVTKEFKKVLAKYNFIKNKNENVFSKYKKILEIENNEEKEILKGFLFANVFKNRKLTD